MGGKRVLIVDDEPHIRRLVQLKLGRLGLEVIEARDGLDAWNQLAAARPSLVILDIMMPKLDGLSFLRKVRESEEWRALPVIMLTAVREEADRKRALELGALAVLQKPFVTDELVEIVKAHVAP
jgi:DNA-binding response OmpR family regulator